MKSARALPDLLLIAILAFAVFCCFFHPAILNPHNFGWVLTGTDNGENALGLHAWLDDPNRGTTLRTTMLNAPDGVAVLFTDSNSLLALVTLPLARLLGPDLQFIGPWILLGFLLHAGFEHALLKPYAPSLWALWLGVALMLLVPALHARWVHANLQAHWLILWSLWIFIDDRRARDARWWTAVLVTATLVHNYLLFQVAAVWATALLRTFITAPRQRDRIIAAAGALLTSGIILLVISRLGITHDFVSTRSYGKFGMPLDALWNPSNASYSMLLPVTEQHLSLAFEGFQYLGAGLLLMIAAWPLLGWRTASSPAVAALNGRLVWLVPTCAGLALLAITNVVAWRGQILLTVPMASALTDLLDPIRASGRLFWVVT